VQVLLIEDDPQVRRTLRINLEVAGYKLLEAETLADAHQLLAENSDIGLFLIDLNLPDGTGYEFLKKVRSSGSSSPTIFLSANTSEEAVVKAMSLGAEDYLRKPFGLKELKARIERVIPSRSIRFGALSISRESRKATMKGKAIDLTPREFDVLLCLVEKSPMVMSREMIMSRLGYDSDTFDRTIDSQVSRLRKKIRESCGDEVKIDSIYGVGYQMTRSKT
jgi:two-component system OmpR family response regulator